MIPTWTFNLPQSFAAFPKVTSPSLRNCRAPTRRALPLEEARGNLHEAVALVLEANRMLAQEAAAGSEVIREPLKVGA